jgi:cellulose synthase (UDP-forming)
MEGVAGVRLGTRARYNLDTRRPRVSKLRTLADVVMVLALAAAGANLVWWRAGMLHHIGPAGWLLFGLEVLTVVWMVLTALLFSGRTSPGQLPPLADPDTTLDIFIPVAGEPLAIVAATLEAARNVRWPANIVVCNDGRLAGKDNWQEIEQLCRQMGVHCLTRTSGPRGKAGNLNHALARSRADGILTIDADHRVAPDVGQQLLGYLRHDEVAFVATPQDFFDARRDSLNPTEPVFYRATQPARDRHGLAFSTGNGVLYRREAIVRIGGFSEWSVVEDLHTSIRLHDAGWRSVFHPRPVSVGIAPRTAAEYARQRVRWAVDSLRILRFDPPWRRRGLNVRAKVYYTHTLVSYLMTMFQVGFLLGPPAWILGRLTLFTDVTWQSQALHIGPWLGALLLALIRWSGFKGAVRSLRLSAAFLPVVFMAALWGTRTGQKARGTVTAKTNLPRFNRLVLAALMLPVALVATLVWGVLDPRAGGSDLAMVWAAFMAVLSIGPLLRLGHGRFWPGLTQLTVVALATALAGGSVATVRLGWQPPVGLYRSFQADQAMAGAVIEINELGAPVITGPAVTPDGARPTVPAAPAEVTVRVGLAAPDRGAYLGFTSDALPYDLGEADRWARNVTEPQIVHWYQQWGSGDSRFRGDWLSEVAASGRVPMISWEAWAKPEGSFRLADQKLGNMADIADGRYDDYIDSWAEAAASYGDPILLRPFHEMNGYWYPWSVGVNGNTYESYVAGWRHVVDRFRAAGADNVSFVWSINTLASFKEGKGVEQAYPGDDYVDWVATSGFNWDDYAPEWSSWVTPQFVFADTYKLLDSFGKPVMFAEIGTGTHGGDPASWVRDAMDYFRTLPDVGAVLWFDRSYDGKIDFRLGPTQQAALGRSVALSDGWFGPEPKLVEHPEIGSEVLGPLSAVGGATSPHHTGGEPLAARRPAGPSGAKAQRSNR